MKKLFFYKSDKHVRSRLNPTSEVETPTSDVGDSADKPKLVTETGRMSLEHSSGAKHFFICEIRVICGSYFGFWVEKKTGQCGRVLDKSLMPAE